MRVDGECGLRRLHQRSCAVGQALLTLGALAGLRMWGTVRSADADLVRSLGATPLAFDGPKDAIFGPGHFDAVFDGIGERGFLRSWASLEKGGTLSAYGLSAAVKTNARLLTVGWWLTRLRVWDLWPNGKAARFYSIVALRNTHPDWYRADLAKLFQLLTAQAINPLVAERIGLEDVPEAHRRLETGGVRGKIVICP